MSKELRHVARVDLYFEEDGSVNALAFSDYDGDDDILAEEFDSKAELLELVGIAHDHHMRWLAAKHDQSVTRSIDYLRKHKPAPPVSHWTSRKGPSK